MDKIIISYVPLLQADRTKIYQVDSPILLSVNTQPMVTSCLWGRYQSNITPVFAIERAKEVVSHLKEWAGGEPEKWFKLYAVKQGNKYIITLFPNLKQVLLGVRESNPEVDLKGAKIICKPLFFVSESLNLFTRVQWQEHPYLGIIDKRDVNANDILGMIEPTVLGPFQLGDPVSIQSFIDVLLKHT